MQRPVSVVVALTVAAVALLGFSTLSTAQTADLAKGASLLSEARKAIGGDNKLAEVKRLQVKGAMRRGQGNLTLNGGAVSPGQAIAAGDIATGKLVFTPVARSSL